MLRGRQVSLGAVIWIVVGLVVAADHHFLDHADTLSKVLSAVLAVAVWPLVVLHIHVAI
ncbi:MAG TPA: hypothetical protein VGI06_11505 [Acidimicrobiales bacterium]